MITINKKQGSDEWKADRASQRNASEASIIMGVHDNVKRDELIHMKATGTEQEFSAWVQKNVLDKGHAVEALARPIIENDLGDDLFPVVGCSDDEYLHASYDGLTFDQTTVWECKQWNKAKAESVSQNKVPECDYWQVVQELAVSGAEQAIYTVTDGTEENTVSAEMKRSEADIKKLYSAWAQFDEDLAAYKTKLTAGEIEQPKQAQSEVIRDLPAVTYKMNGLALTSDLPAFRQQAEALIEKSKQPLETDDDFATAETLVKVFKSAEDKLAGIAEQVLGEVQDIDAFTKDLKQIQEQIRQARLATDKQVKSEKDRRRIEIINKAQHDLNNHIQAQQAKLDGYALPAYQADFVGAMKGKKTIDSLQSAANDELARAKIDISQRADEMQRNLKSFTALAADHKFLFADIQQLLWKEEGDFVAMVKSRIADHKAAEEQRLAVERERIRQEEAAKAARKAEAELLAAEHHSKPAQQARGGDDGEELPLAAEHKPAPHMPRPRNSDLIAVIANHYGVSQNVAAGWLKEMAVAA